MISFDKVNDKRKIDKFSNYILDTQTDKGKREATDGARVDSKRVRITQQWRIVNAIFSIKIKLIPVFKIKKRCGSALKILTYKKSVEKTDLNSLYDRVKAPLTSSVYYYNHLPPLST